MSPTRSSVGNLLMTGVFPRLTALTLFLFLSCTLSASAQTAGPPAAITNADLVKLIQAGLPESAIINKIQANTGAFDTSTDALIALKRAGATDAELAAITAAAPMPVSTSAPAAVTSTPAAALPAPAVIVPTPAPAQPTTDQAAALNAQLNAQTALLEQVAASRTATMIPQLSATLPNSGLDPDKARVLVQGNTLVVGFAEMFAKGSKKGEPKVPMLSNPLELSLVTSTIDLVDGKYQNELRIPAIFSNGDSFPMGSIVVTDEIVGFISYRGTWWEVGPRSTVTLKHRAFSAGGGGNYKICGPTHGCFQMTFGDSRGDDSPTVTFVRAALTNFSAAYNAISQLIAVPK